MAVFGVRRGGVKAYNAKYSKPLGQSYITNGSNEDQVKKIMGNLPDEMKREGFTDRGSRALKADLDAVNALYSSSLEGKLVHFAVTKHKDDKGVEREYVNVGIRTEVPEGGVNKEGAPAREALVFLSVPLRSQEGLKLVHKFVNAKFGEETKLSMFAQMGEVKANGQVYANHTVGLSQNGEKVEAVYPLTLDEKKAIREKMKAEGEEPGDIAKAILKEEYKKTLSQIEVITQRCEAYKVARKAEHAEETENAPKTEHAAEEEEAPGFMDDLGEEEAALPSADQVAGADWD